MPVDPQNFRDAMANLATAVTLVTTDGEAGKSGLTASAVCSVTDSPPTMLVCVNRDSESHDIIQKNGQLCINICNAAQEEISRHLAGMTDLDMKARFELDVWDKSPLGMPMLIEALATLEGKISDSKAVGTHSVFFVELDQIVLGHKPDALTYFSRRFGSLGG